MQLTSTKACALHNYHRPEPLYTELHHIVPQAWQKFWRPVGATGAIWAPTTVALCRTSHGNVHTILVASMHEYANTGKIPTKKWKGQRKESEVAFKAMTTWVEAGGKLELLVTNGYYGEI